MLLKLSRIFGVSIAGLALANVAWGAEGATVTTDANSMKLGGEFRSELIYDDHGLEKATGFTPDKTTTIGVTNVNVKLSGNVNKDTEYAFRFNLLNPVHGPLDYGYGTHWFSKMVGLSVGKMRVMQGGYDNMDSNYRSHTTAVLEAGSNLAVDDYTPMFELGLKVAGDVKLQIINDVTTANGGSWNQSQHPTWVLGWMGQFGGIFPMIDIGSYDNNKSRWFDVGIKTSMAGLNATLDYYNQNQVMKLTDAAGKTKEEANVKTSIALNVGYEIKGMATPWLHFSTYDNKQADNKDLGLEDAKTNSYTPANATTGAAAAYNWDDNGQVIGVGADLAMMGKGWTPFVALVSQSGKFDKNMGAAGTKVEEETKSVMQIKLGVLGEI